MIKEEYMMLKKVLLLLAIMSVLLLVVTQNSVKAPTSSALKNNLQEKLEGSVALFVGSSKAILNNVDTSIDKFEPGVVPFIQDGRTLVPVRFISESFGADVSWLPETRTILVKKDATTIQLVLDSTEMNVNSNKFILDVPAQIFQNRTFVPLRSLVEALGMEVFWSEGLIVISSEEIFNLETDREDILGVIDRLNVLHKVGNLENLRNILTRAMESSEDLYSAGSTRNVKRNEGLILESFEASMDFAPSPSEKQSVSGNASDASSSDFSQTNVQVQGVDEGDIVKTDGQYIYKVNNNEIIIARAYPAENMEVVSRIDLNMEDPKYHFSPIEIFVDQNQLTIIGSKSPNYYRYDYYDNNSIPILRLEESIEESGGFAEESEVELEIEPISDKNIFSGSPSELSIIPPFDYKNYTTVLVYDITDKTKPSQVKNFEIEGNYISSRKIDSFLYLVSNQYIDTYRILQDDAYEPILYFDSSVSTVKREIPLSQISYFPDISETNYLNVAGIDLSSPNTPANINSFLGAGNTIYASRDHLYISVPVYNWKSPSLLEEVDVTVSGFIGIPRIMPIRPMETTTKIFKFALNRGNVTYLHQGEVPGTILNQFSMDEHNRHFRIATTTGDSWGGNDLSNNLYVLDDRMEVVGKIEGIAPTERIYSVRFMGDRAYMVTFEIIDPFFVIDLSDPKNPSILGELKIPGFSNYLHPYDENHVIGFGKDAIEVDGRAVEGGMKISLFDVTDVNNPIEKFVEYIGDRGTHSEILQNHRALLFSKEKDIIAFPVNLHLNKSGKELDEWGWPVYGNLEFQGALVYSLTLDEGFTQRGRITHLNEDEIQKASTYGYDYQKNLERILYIDNTLYTLSNRILKANQISDLKEINAIEISSAKDYNKFEFPTPMPFGEAESLLIDPETTTIFVNRIPLKED
jgi:inhibitor of cysteine peptidase